ncbi:MAG: hypothetical protein M0Q51_13465 [Bacteroidales bacterium]|nr:hypothetical protein [Bacteroidales bacterium]
MKNKVGHKKIDQADVEEKLDELLKQIKRKKSALKKMSRIIPGSSKDEKRNNGQIFNY